MAEEKHFFNNLTFSTKIFVIMSIFLFAQKHKNLCQKVVKSTISCVFYLLFPFRSKNRGDIKSERTKLSFFWKWYRIGTQASDRLSVIFVGRFFRTRRSFRAQTRNILKMLMIYTIFCSYLECRITMYKYS